MKDDSDITSYRSTKPLLRYLEEWGIKERNRLTEQLLQTKPEALKYLRATPSSKLSPGPENLLSYSSACSSLQSAYFLTARIL